MNILKIVAQGLVIGFLIVLLAWVITVRAFAQEVPTTTITSSVLPVTVMEDSGGCSMCAIEETLDLLDLSARLHGIDLDDYRYNEEDPPISYITLLTAIEGERSRAIDQCIQQVWETLLPERKSTPAGQPKPGLPPNTHAKCEATWLQTVYKRIQRLEQDPQHTTNVGGSIQ